MAQTVSDTILIGTFPSLDMGNGHGDPQEPDTNATNSTRECNSLNVFYIGFALLTSETRSALHDLSNDEMQKWNGTSVATELYFISPHEGRSELVSEFV